MKKQIAAAVLAVCVALSAAGCGNSKNPPTSMQMGIVPAEQVTELCAYEAVPVSLSSMYEVSDEHIREAAMELLTGYGLAIREVTDRTVTEAGDYVNVDYTGMLNGEAFAGGTAEDVLIDISNNRDVNRGNGYIDGFSDGLFGVEVGSTIDCEVTFPEAYGVDTLNGQTVVFRFVINGIYAPAELEEIGDETIAATFGAGYGITTKEGLTEFVKQYLEASHYSAVVSKVKAYMVENSTFDIPQEYLDARLAEYEKTYTETYCEEGQTLEDYFMTNFSMTLADAEAELYTYLEEQIKVEFAFAVIADKLEIAVDETEYAAYVRNFTTNGSGTLATEEDVYNYFGAGNKEDGDAYLRNLYRVNKAIDYVAEHAAVSYTD